jgi:predicted alpha-1,2-mannosidase
MSRNRQRDLAEVGRPWLSAEGRIVFNMRRISGLALVALLALAATPAMAAAGSVTQHVNPFIGTDGTGHVFPGATRPFGMVAPSPDNADHGWDYTSGYQYRAPKFLGFSNTHISGAGIPELGDVLLMPAAGKRWTAGSTDFSTAYDKTSERARPGYYTAMLPGHGVKVELTATQRVAFHRYTFRHSGHVQVLVDLQHGLRFGEGLRVTRSDVGVDAAQGEISGTVASKNWVEREASFVLRFSQPIGEVITLPPRPGEKAPRYILGFDLKQGRVLQARVALSTVDVAGARGNLAVDDGKTFDRVRADADAEWNALLSRIAIDATARTRRIFYSALYRVLMHPSDIADADGRVRGPTGQVIKARGGRYYSTLSLWDTFRGVHPLLTLLVPERVDGFVNTLLQHHQAYGYLPLWTAWGRETHTMIGNPALPVIADAVAKGFKGFDVQEALQAMVQTATAPRPNAPAWSQRDWQALDQFGYIPFDRIKGESVSLTLEVGIGDDAVSRVAAAAHQDETAKRFAARASGWRQLLDPQTQLMRARDSEGRWREPFKPLEVTSPMSHPGTNSDYTEANAWQYSLTPGLHDPQGLAQLMGGPYAFGQWLDAFFSVQQRGVDKHQGQEALIGQYAHGNEPSHHIAYLYAYTPQPWKGHALIRRIGREFYADSPAGITGNDDCGQMSAWYVFSTLGFYPVRAASGSYVLGAPQVAAAQLRLANGKSLRIVSEGFAESRPYAAKAWLNGRPADAMQLDHSALTQGGELRFEMKPVPR